MSEKPTFSEGIVSDKRTSTSSGSSSGPSISEVDESVAELIFDALEDQDEFIELSAFADSAIDMPEQYAEYYDLEDIETLSVEDLFGFSWGSYDYVGTPPVFNSDKLTEEDLDVYEDDELYKKDGDMKKYVVRPDYVEAFRDAKVHGGATVAVSKALNGRFGEEVVERFGSDAKISVGAGKEGNHDGDRQEAQKHLAFWVSRSETADFKREKARLEADEITESEFREWAEENGHEDRLDDE